MSTPIQAGSTDQRLRCVAVLNDFSTFKIDLQIADIQSLVVKRSGAADVTVTENALDSDPDDAHTDGNIYNAGGGEYLVSVPDAAVASGAPSVKIYGTWTDGSDSGFLIGDTHPLVSYDWQSSDRSLTNTAITAIGTAFLSTALTKGDPNTIERAFWQLLKTQAVTDGTAVADAGNTLTQFQTNLTAPDGQYDHMIIVFVSNGLDGEARPIETYVQSNGVITLQEPLTEIPTGDEEFIILPQHAHPISEIQAGLATSAQVTALDAIIGSGAGPHAINISVADGVGDVANATCVLKSGTLAKAQGISDASGDLTLYAEDGTYTLITYSDGHVTKSQTVVLDGDDVSVDVTLSAVGVSVPDSPRIRARLLVLDKTTKEGKSGVELQITVTDAAFADGYASEANTITVTSDANGLAEWYALPGESYKITGENVSSTVTVPKTATDPHSVKSVLV